MGVTAAARMRATVRILVATLSLISAAFFVTPAHADDLSRYIRAAVRQPSAESGANADLKRFYEVRHFRPAWDTVAATEAVTAMAAADTEGLEAQDYRVAAAPLPAKGRARSAALAVWDVDLTRTFLRYARDVRIGRLPPSAVYLDIDLPPPAFDAAGELAAALKQGSLKAFIAGLPPPRPEYRALRDALALYRSVTFEDVPVRPNQPLGGLKGQAREKLIRRLAVEDGTVTPAISKGDLGKALRRFQARFGLPQTGRLGEETVAALNRPAAVLTVQIEANMERWRWLPRTADPRYVEVNIADASLKAVDGGKTVLTSPVVLGEKDWLTPILATTAEAIVLNPPWHVPPEIVAEEILPQLQRNAGYLAAHNMVLVDGPAADPHGVKIKWRKVTSDAFPYRVEQMPGPTSGLGAMLFDMPNTFDVYLHDTPAKALFTRTDRFLSHGCVRVQEIAALANWAVSGDPRAPPAHPPGVRTARVALPEPLPVYMLYWTAFAEPDLGLVFRRDVYGLDLRLIAFLHGQGQAAGGRGPRRTLVAAGDSPAP